jgi:hypothetical protein
LVSSKIRSKENSLGKVQIFPGKKLSISREIIMENVNEKQIDWLFKERG